MSLLAGIFILIFPSIKIYFFQNFYGQYSFYDVPNETNAQITLLSEQDAQTFTRKEYTIKFTPKAQIDLYARVVYVQYNDTLFLPLIIIHLLCMILFPL